MNVTVAFLDVGQGDCTVAIDRNAKVAVVIDCPENYGERVAAALRASGVSSVALALVTHSHMDHVGGMYEVITAFRTQEVRFNLDTVVTAGRKERIKLRALRRAYEGLEDLGIKLQGACAGDKGSVGDVSWVAVAPTYGQLSGAQGRADPNYASVIVRLEVGALRVLIAGDSDGRSWRKAMSRGEDLQANVLRLPHHGGALPPGADRASLDEILDAVGASHHVISVGTTRPHHPDPSTLRVLGARARSARVLCTEINSMCLGGSTLSAVRTKHVEQDDPHSLQFRSDGCPCAGTIVVEVHDEGWTLMPDQASHNRVIHSLGSPMCQPWRTGQVLTETEAADPPMSTHEAEDSIEPRGLAPQSLDACFKDVLKAS
jgi:beta-lactamase superfamily II metal-dependent hydrolase